MTTTFYIATDGNDANPGTLELPFATPKRARDVARELRDDKKQLPEPVTVQLRGGVYYLEDTLRFYWLDGGAHEHPMTWEAYPGETPVISGGVVVREWEVHEGKILKASLPQEARHRGMIRQLFYQEQAMPRSAFPKRVASRYDGWLLNSASHPENPKNSFYVNTDHLPRRWAKPYLAEIEAFAGAVIWTWCNQWSPVRHINFDTGEVNLNRDIIDLDWQPWYMERGYWDDNRIRFENVLEELTEPGEWCIDYDEGVVYFWPPDDNPSPEVVIPHLKTLISMRDLKHLHLRGLTFRHSLGGDNYHRHGLTGYGAMLPQAEWPYVGEAVHLREAHECLIEDCTFDRVGGNAVYIERESTRNIVRRCEIDRAGANGVVVIGMKTRHPLFNIVEDCHIHHVGAINNYCAGVFLGTSDGTMVRHNEIHDVPHHAVNLATNGIGRNFIEWNHIERAALENMDIGAINAWMDEPMPTVMGDTARSGHIIRFNLIKDTRGAREYTSVDGKTIRNVDHPHGIYLDDYTSNCLIFGNIIINAGQGLLIHNGRHNIVENNIFVDCDRLVWLTNGASGRQGNEPLANWGIGSHFFRNIHVMEGDNNVLVIVHAQWGVTAEMAERWMGFMDGNVYWQREGLSLESRMCVEPGSGASLDNIAGCATISLEAWRARGFDLESVEADPLFEDYQQGNFTLRPDSPALKLGFQPISFEKIGIRKAAIEP